MTHPLTFEKIAAISKQRLITMDLTEDMRSAADWQLEQVIEWLETALEYDPELANTRPYIHLDLKEAMRPQEES